MPDVIQPTPAEARSAACFNALMWGLSHPGEIQSLPKAGMVDVAESLIDRECSFYAEDETLRTRLAALGAYERPLENAEFVFAGLDRPDAPSLIARLATGDLAYPDSGATLFAPARFADGGTQLDLTGPGIAGNRIVSIAGVDAGIWEARRKAIAYPLGFELVLVDHDRLLALPRSCHASVI